MMQKILIKTFIVKFLLLLVFTNYSAFSKPLPPGSGEGDVPANILILLDSSLSMQSTPFVGDAMNVPSDVVLLDDGDVIVAQTQRGGFIKFDYSTEKLDKTFAANKRVFRGKQFDTCVLDGTQDSRVASINAGVGISSDVAGYTGEVIYGTDQNSNNGKVVGISASGECVEVYSNARLGFTPRTLTIRTINSEDQMVVSGKIRKCTKWRGRGKKRRCRRWSETSHWFGRNLTTGDEKQCTVSGDLNTVLRHSYSITMDNGNNIYVAKGGDVYKYAIKKDGGVYCPTNSNLVKQFTLANSDINSASQIEIDPQTPTLMYLTSADESTLQSLTISDTTLTEVDKVGGSEDPEKTPEGASADINLTKLSRTSALHVSNNRVWVGGSKNSVQEFNISGDIAWVDEMGSARLSRFDGAKRAIKRIVRNSGLLAGANFGFGHWNAGRVVKVKKGKKKYKWCNTCEYTCHKECPKGNKLNCNDHCQYYDGWNTLGGTYPKGQSKLCNKNSCLNVAIKPHSSREIVRALDRIGLAFGTDANAFSQIAYKYFNDANFDVIKDTTKDCQLNYVIVIGDGAWTHHDEAKEYIEDLREDHKVKTLFVAYGLGISTKGMNNFKKMAITGSCTKDPNDYDNALKDNEAGCEPVIEAKTPQALLTKLESKIQQIVASRLSFTAPAITATIQEGGSLYQAQFGHIQFGEWQGRIVKKKITSEGNVDHDNIVWDSSDEVKTQTIEDSRKIWTVMDGAKYWGNWNNFHENKAAKVNNLFQMLGKRVTDYHKPGSECGGTAGNSDDITGLINFVRGSDYFDYDGDCVIDVPRTHVLGDIYHSQLVEVGAPSANTNFTSTNEEAYFRAKHNYESFAREHINRQKIIYAGANDGMLHAFNADTGKEEWGFVPPFIAAQMPIIINEDLDGAGESGAGGTNPIFAVDGSPVVHDAFIAGLNVDGTYESGKSWHTLLFIPYGRGGAGFSVLDVTNPIIDGSQGPLHMFSIFNDIDNSRVLVSNKDGLINAYPYDSRTFTIADSLEAQTARNNQNAAAAEDADEGEEVTTKQDEIAECQKNDDVDGGFAAGSNNSCYYGTTFQFEFKATQDQVDNPSRLSIESWEDGQQKQIFATSVSVDGDITTISFGGDVKTIDDAETESDVLVFNASRSDSEDSYGDQGDNFTIAVKHEGVKTDKSYDYSLLGETWSNPRIFRMPNAENENEDSIDEDEYVAVMGGGYGTDRGIGSAVFVISLEDIQYAPGTIASADANDGPIKIVDLNTSFDTYVDIENSITADPVLITPDVYRGAKWRGGMLYINDVEGKITKINLTNLSDNGKIGAAKQDVSLFDQTTLFTLNANNQNSRYTFHGMDAAIGRDTRNLWLFGGSGDYTKIGSEGRGMDNILFGVRDEHFPNFEHLYDVIVPEGSSSDFETTAIAAAALADNADDTDELTGNCVDNSWGGTTCPGDVDKKAWIFKLDKRTDYDDDIEPAANTDIAGAYSRNRYRKVSAPPTVYKGSVYYPIYEPPIGNKKCNMGKAFICSADDECGINNSDKIGRSNTTASDTAGFDENAGCYFIRKGVLSKLVIFGDELFANIATEGEQKDTLVQILSGAGEIDIYRGSWRQNY